MCIGRRSSHIPLLSFVVLARDQFASASGVLRSVGVSFTARVESRGSIGDLGTGNRMTVYSFLSLLADDQNPAHAAVRRQPEGVLPPSSHETICGSQSR